MMVKQSDPTGSQWHLRAYAVLMGVIGLGLAVPGVELLRLGGSLYYLAAGLACLGAAILLWRRSRFGVWLYALFIVATLVWTIAECGFDAWAWLPRLLAPCIFGLWLLAPWTRRALGWSPAPTEWRWWAAAAVAIVVTGAAGYAALLRPPALGDGTVPRIALAPGQGDWPHYGNDAGGSRFSALDQINPANVGGLKLAWAFRAGLPATGQLQSIEAAPLKIGETLYFCTGGNDVIALDAETGQQRWRFAAHPDGRGVYGRTCRGVTYYRVPDAKGPCAARIYTATIDARLIALDAATGAPCPGFGKAGVVNLLEGMGDVWKGYYFVTSPPQLIRGKLVLGGWVSDGQYVGEPSGVVRAFDAVTGQFAWAFDIGRPDDHGMPPAGGSYSRGTPNSWAPMSADEALGLVYVPTGNATPDYYGGHRTALDDRFSSSVVALDAETGAVRWSFQTTHHDLWDYDVAAQPTLVDLPSGVKGLLQPTKRGEIFFLDRRTGRPLADVTERPAPQGGVPGERLSPTQPYSTGLPSFAGPPLSEASMWGVTPFDQLWCRIRFRQARYDGPTTPLGIDRPTVVYPGYLGGIDWGSVAVDPARGVMIVNSSRVANYDRLITRAEANRMGIEPNRLGGRSEVGGPVAQKGTPYGADIRPFLSPLGVPCQQPPYGMLSAVDLNSHKLVWTQRFGTAMDSGPLGIPARLPLTMGVPNLGGAVVLRSGLFFIGASQDAYLRAYGTTTGRELWQARLPAGGQANPISYVSNASGRQFIVIAAAGHGGLGTKTGDWLLAYALPKDSRAGAASGTNRR